MDALGGNKARYVSVLVILGLAGWLFGGCAGMYVDPGPRPARIKLSVKAKVDMQDVDKAMEGRCTNTPWVLTPWAPIGNGDFI